MFQYAHPEYLQFLIGLPLLLLVFWLARRHRVRLLQEFGDLPVIAPLLSDTSRLRPWLKTVLFLLGLFFLIVAIAGPQVGSRLGEVKKKGVELVFCLDVSNSMLAEDIQPNRLEKARLAIGRMIDQLENDKVGLIIFAGRAYTQLPMTTDLGAAKMFLRTVNTEVVPTQGTSIGSALEMAMNSFTAESEKSKTIIVFTDGENHEDDPLEMATLASEKGIVVHAVGMGTPEGSPIPSRAGRSSFRTDRSGQVIITKLDEITLQKMATTTNGIYVRAGNAPNALKPLYDAIDNMQKVDISSKVYSDYEERYQYALGLSLFFFLLEFIVLERKSRYFRRFNLFTPLQWTGKKN